MVGAQGNALRITYYLLVHLTLGEHLNLAAVILSRREAYITERVTGLLKGNWSPPTDLQLRPKSETKEFVTPTCADTTQAKFAQLEYQVSSS